MTEAKFMTTREGDEIVVRTSLTALAALLLSDDASDLGGPVEIVDGDALLDELVTQMNRCNGVEAMILSEVAEAMDVGTTALRLLPRAPRPAPDPTRHPRHVIENERDVALAQIRANGIDLPNPNMKH